MSAEIIKVYKQDVPPLRFIGKKYGDKDRVDGMYSKYWGEWDKNAWWDVVKKQCAIDIKNLYEGADTGIGLMREKEGELFEYWIGLFMPESTPVPEGFKYHDFERSTLGVCWIYGEMPEITGKERDCHKKLLENGYEVIKDPENALWFFERCIDPRFFIPDEKGKIILDICFFIK
jgi:predicted transcriptional regulator YdeE